VINEGAKGQKRRVEIEWNQGGLISNEEMIEENHLKPVDLRNQYG
jgi:hypothetical protein